MPLPTPPLYTDWTPYARQVLIARLELILTMLGQFNLSLTHQAQEAMGIARIQIETRAALSRLDPSNPALTP
jgi:hypothetical protein